MHSLYGKVRVFCFVIFPLLFISCDCVSFINNWVGAQVWSHHQLYTCITQEAQQKEMPHSRCAKPDQLITVSQDSPQWHRDNRKHGNNKADFMRCLERREFADSHISCLVELPLGREGGRQRMQHVLISANKGVVSLFSPSLLCPSASGGERCWLLVLLLSCGWQNGLLGNLSGQVEERSAASSVTVFPPPVFTFCLFGERESRTPLSPSLSPSPLTSKLISPSHRFVFSLCIPLLPSRLTSL